MKDNEHFERIAGDCAGVDIASLTESDIRDQAQVWRDAGESVTDEEVEAAIRHLYQMKQGFIDADGDGTLFI